MESMTRDEYFQHHERLCREALELSKKKNHDYAGKGDPFANFSRVEAMGICSTEKGFLVRLTDKMSRLSTFCEQGEFKVKDETFHDTIIDVVNYAILMSAYVEGRKRRDG